ncbi:DUF4349 domain-containing protein [Lentibacillus salinarum]|uniref:DUF4349 domain-containing protein n=1 Tax=Lentibacillus salinarum TaxID=446820 RepID=A0ABW3ZVP8_9BACI
MKKELFMFMLSIGLLLTACSNESEEHDSMTDQADMDIEESETESTTLNATDDASMDKNVPTDQEQPESNEENAAQQADETNQDDRKVIYTANLRIEVKDYQKTVDAIQADASDSGGYIVESNMHEGNEEGLTTGRVTVRVPQDQFQAFIQMVEDGSSNVLESSTSGQDVTEEYVDLESRLDSKQVVEERLLSFMEQADETEDLLKISDDLADVQQEIEEITGRMHYLDNKVDLATVTIRIEENNVSLSGEDDLNTWDKTKGQFMKSINFLLSVFSGLFVFMIGGLPVLIILAIIGGGAFWMIRKRKKRHQENE